MLKATAEIRGTEPIAAVLHSICVLELPDSRPTDRPRCAVIVVSRLRANFDTPLPHKLIEWQFTHRLDRSITGRSICADEYKFRQLMQR